jgi:hypothetical protein
MKFRTAIVLSAAIAGALVVASVIHQNDEDNKKAQAAGFNSAADWNQAQGLGLHSQHELENWRHNQIIKDATAAKQSPPKAAEASNDIMANKDFLAKNPKYLDAVRTLITNSGYECPRLANLFISPDNPTPLGIKLEALCGPRGSTGAYTQLHYSVYPDRLMVVVCKPFGIFGGGCE